MTDLTPDQEGAMLESLATVCREAGYVVEAIDRGLEVSGEDEGAFYLLPDHGWLQARCLVLGPEDLDEARDLTALFETMARAQFRLIGCRFGFDPASGLWLVEDLYPGFDPNIVPTVLEQLGFIWEALEGLFEAALTGAVPNDDAFDAAFDLEAATPPN
ncbi:hypothetical protein [Caulobacter sp.]|jgi:hypothetical protein|uniref:hypothetical protein n=1 Tax=Caulobacter sp. TaxID=78 RepID=UPI001622E65E